MLLECGAVVLVHRTIPLRTRGHFAELLAPSTGSCAHLCEVFNLRDNPTVQALTSTEASGSGGSPVSSLCT